MNGEPIGGDYPDPRSFGDRSAEQREVHKQVDHLVELAREPATQGRYLTTLQKRRAGSAAVVLEQVPRDGGPVYVAAGSVLVHSRRIDTDAATALRDRFGLVVAEVDPRTGASRLETPPSVLRERKVSTPALVEQLVADGFDARVNHIVPLGVVMKAEGGPEPTALRRPFPAVAVPPSGAAPLVAVIDTGISIEQRTDGYLQNLLEPDNVDPLDAFPPPLGDGLLDAAAGHGAFVTGVVQQVAPSARLRVYRVTDSDGICTDAQVGAAITRAAADGADIINLSLGTSTDDGLCPPAMRTAIENAVADRPGILIVAAAGNDGASPDPVWPAALATEIPNVVSVAGLDPEGHGNDWSSRGDWVRCSAIGQGVASTYVIGAEDGPLIGDPDPDTYGPDAWAVWTGTSFAAPQIAGRVARMCHEKTMAPLDALAELLAGAPDDIPGWGRRVVVLPGT